MGLLIFEIKLINVSKTCIKINKKLFWLYKLLKKLQHFSNMFKKNVCPLSNFKIKRACCHIQQLVRKKLFVIYIMNYCKEKNIVMIQQTNCFIYEEKNNQNEFDQQKLLQLHKKIGNKWKEISQYFLKRDVASIKNHFYSILRKSLRKINNFILKSSFYVKTQKNKPFRLNFIFKIANLSDGQRKNNLSTQKNQDSFVYRGLLYRLISLKEIKQQHIYKICCEQQNNAGTLQNKYATQLNSIIDQLKTIQKMFYCNHLNKKGRSRKKYSKSNLIQKFVEIKTNQQIISNSKSDYNQLDNHSEIVIRNYMESQGQFIYQKDLFQVLNNSYELTSQATILFS